MAEVIADYYREWIIKDTLVALGVFLFTPGQASFYSVSSPLDRSYEGS